MQVREDGANEHCLWSGDCVVERRGAGQKSQKLCGGWLGTGGETMVEQV